MPIGGIQPGPQALGAVQDIIRAQTPQVGFEESPALAFESLLNAYMGIVGDAGRNVDIAQNLQVQFALGNHEDMLSVILAQEMAYTSMHFAVQVTSRIIEAYREIMRMQI
ncbi:MAG: flagellar hook-basal body complex protein FliE [Clostridiales bacterium]|nr:flagellar hook-basal body complex protein FliE [Clostridiales bacterium]